MTGAPAAVPPAAVPPAAVPPAAAPAASGMTPPPQMAAAFDHYSKALAQYHRATEQAQQAEAPAFAAASHALAAPIPQGPHLAKLPPAPVASQHVKTWASLAGMLAVVFGGQSRQDLIRSMDNMTGLLQGQREHNELQFHSALQTWNDSAKAAQVSNENELQQYKDALTNRKLTIDQKMNEVKVVAMQQGNKVMYALAQAKNYGGLASMWDKMYQTVATLSVNRQAAYEKMMGDVGFGQNAAEIRYHVPLAGGTAPDDTAPSSGGPYPGLNQMIEGLKRSAMQNPSDFGIAGYARRTVGTVTGLLNSVDPTSAILPGGWVRKSASLGSQSAYFRTQVKSVQNAIRTIMQHGSGNLSKANAEAISHFVSASRFQSADQFVAQLNAVQGILGMQPAGAAPAPGAVSPYNGAVSLPGPHGPLLASQNPGMSVSDNHVTLRSVGGLWQQQGP